VSSRRVNNGAKSTSLHEKTIIAGRLLAVSFLQPHFKAGSIPDLVCELVLFPGKVFATLFRDRGDASPDFLWRSRIATAVVLTGVAWCGFAVRRRRTESPMAPRRCSEIACIVMSAGYW
jgi:hypothetical protein